MKRFINSLGMGLMLAFAMLLSRPVDAQPRVGVSINFQTFYDELSPYGEWIDYPEYGYTWRPRVGSDFRPYATNGSWAYTADNDWMWNSGYDWGWAPFHYGRWFNDPFYGWLWVPGYEWSPAWVSWRGGGDYYGWAPIRPGINISIGFGGYNPPYDYWTFAPGRYMNSVHIGRYFYPYRNNVTIINRTTIINNYNYGSRGGNYRGGRNSYYTNGPRRGDVERYTGRINAVTVRNSDRPGRATVSRNAVSVYRPSVSRNDNRSTYAPRDVQRYDRNSVASRGADRSGRTNEVRSNSRDNDSRDYRVNSAPRREDAVRTERSDEGRGAANRQESSRRFGNDADRNVQRNSEMRERQQQMQRSQEGQSSTDRSAAMRQRNEAAQQQRSTEMRQRNEAERQQRSEAMRQQREASAQRESQARMESQQRSVQQRQMESRSREVQVQRQQSAPRVERQVPSRSFESRSSAPARSMGGGESRGSRGGGESRGRGR